MNFEYNLPLIDKDREITYFQVYRTDKTDRSTMNKTKFFFKTKF